MGKAIPPKSDNEYIPEETISKPKPVLNNHNHHHAEVNRPAEVRKAAPAPANDLLGNLRLRLFKYYYI